MEGYIAAGAVCAMILGVILILYMRQEARQNRVLVHDLAFPDLPAADGLTLFFISDVHRRSINRDMISFISSRADFTVIGGDLREGGVSFKQTAANIRLLKQAGPVYFVWGNNDYEGDAQTFQELLEEMGVLILRNSAVSLNVMQGCGIELIGIDDISEELDDLEEALANAGRGFRILISHNPEIAASLEDDQQIKLVLSGHTHGGQIRLFGLGPYEHGGIKVQNGTVLLTSNGYGTSKLPLRLGAQPETHLLVLSRGETKLRRPAVHTFS